jgi:hypothetical protein
VLPASAAKKKKKKITNEDEFGLDASAGDTDVDDDKQSLNGSFDQRPQLDSSRPVPAMEAVSGVDNTGPLTIQPSSGPSSMSMSEGPLSPVIIQQTEAIVHRAVTSLREQHVIAFDVPTNSNSGYDIWLIFMCN